MTGFLIMLAERIFLSALTSPPGDEPMETNYKTMRMTTETTTQDIWLAAVACQNGYELYDLRKLGDRKLFVFEDREAFQLLKRDYYWHRLK